MFRNIRILSAAILTAALAPNAFASPPIKAPVAPGHSAPAHKPVAQPTHQEHGAEGHKSQAPVNSDYKTVGSNNAIWSPKITNPGLAPSTASAVPVWSSGNKGNAQFGQPFTVSGGKPGTLASKQGLWKPTNVLVAFGGNLVPTGTSAGTVEVSGQPVVVAPPVVSSGSSVPANTGTESSEATATPDSEAVYGVVLTAAPEGAAATAKLKQNDVFISLGGERTASTDDLAAASKKFAGQKVAAVILDGETGVEKPVLITPAADGLLGITCLQVRVK